MSRRRSEVAPGRPRPGETAVVLRVLGVDKVFDTPGGKHRALSAVDLEIMDGELLTILGPSGCGKTTLLRVLAGFEHPTRGDVLLDGVRLTEVPPNKRPMAMVFQSYALFPHLTVFENIAYGLRVAKVPRSEIRERVEVVLSIMDLVGFGDRMPTQLSGGQQQRVALARSIVVRPRVLLFDEPLSNLDARLRDHMRSELRRIQRQLGVTSVYVTHDQTEAMAMSDRIVVMSEGRIEQVGTPAEIYRQPDTVFVADFIGKANVLSARLVEDAGSEGGSVTVELFGVHLAMHGQSSSGGGAGAALSVVLRPEDIGVEVHPSPNDHTTQVGESEVRIAGWLRGLEYHGAATHLTLELADGTLLAAAAHHTARHGPDELPPDGAGIVAVVPLAALRLVRSQR